MLNPTTLFLFLVIAFVMYGAYSTARKKKQVLLIYHRETGQILEQFGTVRDRTVDIDNKRFTIMPDRHFLLWWDRGIHQFFGTWVITYEFSFDSKYPHDPKNFKDNVVSPAVAKVLNNEARMSSFAKGVSNQGSGTKKQGMMEKYGIYIAALVILAIVYMVFKQGGQITALTKSVNTLMGK
jgi:hypothetical protein